MKAKLAMLMAVFMALSVFFVAADVCDGDLCVTEVEVDGDDVSDGDLIVLDRGQDIEVDLNLRADSDVDDVQIQVLMTGYEHGVLEDSSKTFSMREDRVYSKDFVLSIPSDLDVDEDNEGVYKLRVIVGDADSSTIVFDFDLVFEADRHEVEVKDILLDPSEVVSGRGVIAAVRVKNNGAKDEDDGVKVTVSIPALGIEASEFIDELDSEESTTSEDLYLRVPKCAEAGTYVVRAEAEFNDGRDSVVEETSVKVVADETCNVANEGDDEEDSRMIITVPKAQEVNAGGEGSPYNIMVTNVGSSSKQVRVSVSGVEAWGSASMEGGSVVVVGPRQTETVYLTVSANEDTSAGTQVFVVDVQSGDESESIALTANIVASEKEESPLQDWTRIKKGLEIGLVVLVVLLVILGLIVGFNKLKGNDDDEEVSGQTYY